MADRLLMLKAPHFTAGAVVLDGATVVTDAAPICRYMIGWTEEAVRAYAARRGWTVEQVLPLNG